MSSQVAVVWDGPLLFTRLIEECGHSCELVTPHLLAAPFFRRRLNGLVVPAGFASSRYTCILSALRAIKPRIQRYVQEGGTLLSFGAGADFPYAYDWLPVQVFYQYGFATTPVRCHDNNPFVSIIEDGIKEVSIDGILNTSSGENDSQVILQSPEGPVMLEILYGKGRILVASLHEYPSRRFVHVFCASEGEGLL